MDLFLSITPVGICMLDGRGELIDFSRFPNDPEDAAERLHLIRSGKAVDELRDLISRWIGNIDTLYLDSSSLRDTVLGEFPGINTKVAPNMDPFVLLRGKKREIMSAISGKGKEELQDLLVDISLSLARMQIKKELSRKDLLVMKAVDYLDHLNKSLNILMPAVREWFSIYMPELDSIVEDHELFVRAAMAIAGDGGKDDLLRAGLPDEVANRLSEAMKKTLGIGVKGEIRDVISVLSELFKTRERVERYIEGLMREIAPNLSDVAGPLLGARLITMAGGLDKLAQLPASTIQILGAHKAIFLHMTKGTKPPKHGILFQAKEVRSAPKKLRGKIARLLATKISIAARVDAYGSDRSVGKRLREEIDERLAKLRGG
jgi:nucleolar protein 56